MTSARALFGVATKGGLLFASSGRIYLCIDVVVDWSSSLRSNAVSIPKAASRGCCILRLEIEA